MRCSTTVDGAVNGEADGARAAADHEHVKGARRRVVETEQARQTQQREHAAASQHLARGGNSGTIDDDAQRAERNGRINRRLHVFFAGHIGRREDGPFPQFRRILGPRGSREVNQHHGGPGVVQAAGGGSPQAGRTPGHQRNGIGNLHVNLLK